MKTSTSPIASRILIIIFLTSFSFSAISQDETQNVNPLLDELPEFESEFENFGMLRFKANHFYHKMIQVTEPGVVSSLWDINDNTSNKKSYVLHGDIYLPVGMGGYGWRIGKKFIHTLQFIPQVQVRILRDDPALGDTSLPVRTPSWMPRLLWNFTTTDLWDYHNMNWSFYGALSAFHHSNGQDGFELINGAVNTYNGNFGEDVVFEVRVGATKAYIRKTPSTKARKNLKFLSKSYNSVDSIRSRKEQRTNESLRLINVPYDYINEINHRLAFEWHPESLSNQTFAQFDLYGRYRFNYLFNFRKIKKYQSVFNSSSGNTQTIGDKRWEESYRITFKTTFIAGPLNTGVVNNLEKAEISDRVNAHVSFYWMFKGSDNAALFVRGSYMGSDEYNIYFQDRVWLGRLGIAFGFFNHD